MASRIDPDAVPLYKELKPLHAQLKRAMKDKAASRIEECFNAIFGSHFERYSTTDANHNTHEEISWSCPVPAKSIRAMFNASVVVHLDDDSNFTQLVMNDKWIYGALLPLGLKMDMHAAWMEQLGHVIELLKQKPAAKPEYFNVWDEATIVENAGFRMDEDIDGKPVMHAVAAPEAMTLRATMGMLQEEPARANVLWPALAPWLNAMQTLSPSPDPLAEPRNIEAWQTWAGPLKTVYLQRDQHTAMELPESFSPH